MTTVPREATEMGIFPTILRAVVETYGRCALFRLVLADAGMISRLNAGFVHNELNMGKDFANKRNQTELCGEAALLFANFPATPAARPTRASTGSPPNHLRLRLVPTELSLNSRLL